MLKRIIVDNGQSFDFGKASAEYAKYRDIYPKEVYDRLLTLGIGRKNSRWLDLGTGTGVIPRGLAVYGADIIGVDISAEQIEQARVLSSEFGNIAYRVCAAENIDFPENSFDAVTACQCFWYFDPQLVVPLINKIIKPGGTFLKMYMSWSEDDPIAEISQRLVKKYNPAWSSGAPAMEDLKKHHFGNPQTEKFYTDLTFSRDSWHGRIKACRGVLASMDNETFENFEAENLRGLTALPEQFTVRHEIFLTWYNIEKSEFCPVRTSV